jgi:2-oxoglutarate ferredoxin oxidoreductase subunit delta
MSRITIDEDRCKGCGLCTFVCPQDLVHISEHFNAKGYRPAVFVDPHGACVGCSNCAMMCPDVAIVVHRTAKQRSDREESTVAHMERIPAPSVEVV